MKDLVFITGNQNKANQLAKWLGHPVKHHKLDLDEIQSLDLRNIVEHKVRQAYDILKTPVVVEDVSLSFTALERLPGPFIKWFIDELGVERVAALAQGLEHQCAVASICYGLYDGHAIHYFEAVMSGTIAAHPKGEGGFGFDRIFKNEGYEVTRGEMNEADYENTSSRRQAIHKLKDYLDRH
jgi:non-canonical purine NTP pyrophosphatase (RdgB/HAM1 family)